MMRHTIVAVVAAAGLVTAAATRVRLRGTVQGVDERVITQAWIVSIWAGGHVVDVELPQEDFARRPDWLVDAEIEVVGIAGSYRNGRGEIVAPNLTVARRDDLAVITPAPESPFAAERLPLDDLARYRPRRRGGHRVCTEGVVSRAFPDRLFLHDVAGGVRVTIGKPSRGGCAVRKRSRSSRPCPTFSPGG